jgi:glycosyltransferase involved in cell wall biosynthesis
MKVALISPASPAQGRLFGAERLIESTYRALSKVCEAERIEVPVSEATWDGVLESYLDCYDLDVAKYDAVISTKNPTFMVRHPNHICWLIHQIRVFYDRFDDEYGHCDPVSLAEHSKRRDRIHQLDNLAFKGVRKTFTIGQEVSRRLKHYNGFDSEALHPPLENRGYFCGGQEYFLLPGRLHRWKRVDLAIRAFKLTRAQIPLLIAGTGEDEPYFKELAIDDPRIKFLGYVSDDEIIELYAHALGVLFVPKDEDFGYVTLEAMMSHKPVITCSDSGEPTAFVRNEHSGFVTKPEPADVAAAIESLAANPSSAARMGENGFRDVPRLSWDDVAQRLLAGAGSSHFTLGASQARSNGSGIKVLVSDNQILDPPVGGGRLRIYQLYRHLASFGFDVTYVGAYDWPGPTYREQNLSPHFREIVTPLTQVHFRLDGWIKWCAGGRTVIDTTIPYLLRCSPRFARLAEAEAKDSRVIVISHPWVYPYVPRRPDQLLIYDAHNCEYLVKKKILGSTMAGRLLAAGVRRLERKLCREADLIFACSMEDAQELSRLYGVSKDKIVLVPNGVSIEDVCPAHEHEKSHAKHELGLPLERPLLVFVGSGYQPNAEAASFIVSQIAEKLPECHFYIVGGVVDSFDPHDAQGPSRLLPNVTWTGTVHNQRKLTIYKACDIAINPMFSGSGTNLKMLDYFAAGLPVVSTPAGARGLELAGGACVVCPADQFVEEIRYLLSDPARRDELAQKARRVAVEHFAWPGIARGATETIRSALERGSVDVVARTA